MAVNLTPIHTSTPLRTRKGTVSVYDESYKGTLIQPARTNLLLNSRDLSQSAWHKFATCTVTGTNQVNLPAVGDRIHQSKSITNGKAISASGIYSGSGTVDLQLEVPGKAPKVVTITLTTTPTRYSVTETAAADGTVYAFMARRNVDRTATAAILDYTQLEIGSFSTSPIPTGATTITRPAANLTRPTAGTALAALNNWATLIRFRPTAAGQTAVLWGSYTDANNSTQVDLAATTLTFKKRLAGADHVAQTSLTHAADTLYEALLYQHSVHGMGIAFRSWNGSAWSSWSTWVDLTDADGIANAAIASTYQIGAANNSSHVCANMPFVEVIAIPASVEPQAWLMSQLAKGRI